MKHNPGRTPDARYIDQAVDFASQTETTKLIKHLQGQPRPLIMADALSDVLAIQGLDEDKSKEVTRVYKGIRRVVDALDASFGMLHHQGWTEKRERGSTAIRDNSDILVRIKKFDPLNGMLELEHLKRRSGAGPLLKAFYLNAKLITVDGYKDQIPIVTGPKSDASDSLRRDAAQDASEKERHAKTLVKVVAQHFPYGARTSRLKEKCESEGIKKTVFYEEALECAAEKHWIVRSGKRKPYNLNPDGSWKEAGPDFGSAGVSYRPPGPSEPNIVVSYRPPGPSEPTIVGSRGPNPDQIRTNGPNASCENADTTGSAEKSSQINEAESSISSGNNGHDKVVSLFAKASEAIAHVDQNKKK
jgi:hypothetical protein